MSSASQISRRQQWYKKHLGYIPGEQRGIGQKGIDRLPSEILTSIFRYLDAFDLIMCSLVCRRWHDLASDDYVWKTLYENAKSASKTSKKTVSTNDIKEGFKQLYISNGVAVRSMYIKRISEQVISRQRVKSDPRCFNPFNHAVLKRYPGDVQLTLFDSDGHSLFSASRSLRPDSSAACLSLTFSLSDLTSPPPLSRLSRAQLLLRLPLYSVSELRRPGERGPITSCRLMSDWEVRKDGRVVETDGEVKLVMGKMGQIVVGEWKRGGGVAFVRVAVRQSQIEEAIRTLESVKEEKKKSTKETKKRRDLALEDNTGSVEIRCGSDVIYFGSWRSFDFNAAGVAVPAEGNSMAEPLPSGGLCMPWRSGGLGGHIQRLLHCTACVKNFIHCKRGEDSLVWDVNGFCEMLPAPENMKVNYDVGGELHEAVLATETGRVRLLLRITENETNDSGDEDYRVPAKFKSGPRAFLVRVSFEKI